MRFQYQTLVKQHLSHDLPLLATDMHPVPDQGMNPIPSDHYECFMPRPLIGSFPSPRC